MSKHRVTIVQIFRAERRITVEIDAADRESTIEELQSGAIDAPDFDDPRWATGWDILNEVYE